MKEALKLALEALEMFCEYGAILRPIETRDAIKEALREHAMYEVQRLGQEIQPEQEPVAYSKEQMQIYAEANYEAGYSTGYMVCEVKEHEGKNLVAYVKANEIEELKNCNGMSLWAENALIHTNDSITKQLIPSGYVALYTHPPLPTAQPKEPKQEPATKEQIREAMIFNLPLYTMPPHPDQEPVAWMYEFYADMGHKGLAFEEQRSAYNTPLYITPPQRTWVGLSKEDKEKISSTTGWHSAMLLTEEILMEKNT